MAGLAVLVGVASVSARPALFLGAGLLAFLAATAAGIVLATRKLPASRARGPVCSVAAELAAHRLTVRRLLHRYGILRVRRSPAERAAADAGLRVQAVSWQARRAGRLAELGFADLAGYLRARRVEQGWSVRRMRAELHVGRRWLVAELDRLGLRP
jgi:hypothetical protein